MDKVYAALILKGLKSIEDVPQRLRPAVAELLIAEKSKEDIAPETQRRSE